MKLWGQFSFCIAALALAACSTRSRIEPRNAPRDINDSFFVNSKSGVGLAKDFRISIAKASLEKEFLLQGNLVDQDLAPMGQALKSRLVIFKQRGGKLLMLESPRGHAVTDELPQNLLLAEFNVVEESTQALTFDFNQGMSQLFVIGDMGGQDFEPGYPGMMSFAGMDLERSYLDDVKVDAQNRLVIRQVAQARLNATLNGVTTSSFMMPVETRYYLQPYQADDTYKPLMATLLDYQHFALFETQPQLTLKGDEVSYWMRWNPNRPAVYAISSNTPAEFKQAVREGVLYWNKVAGRELLQVVEAPAGVNAPNPDYNIIQWINYDAAGFAYADMQADPTSGQLNHVQIYLPSGFAFYSKQQAQAILRRMKAGAARPKVKLSLRGFETQAACDLDLRQALQSGLETLLAKDVSDELALKAAQDWVRLVTAHEVGHTIGLRHNFAGSLAATYELPDHQVMAAAYFETRHAPMDVTLTSSVMDYYGPEQSFMLGDQIKQGAAFTYDQKVIGYIYNEGPGPSKDWPLFCTDSGMQRRPGGFADCMVFDLGKSEIEYISFAETQALRDLPNTLLEKYIDAKSPYGNARVTPVESVRLGDPLKQAQRILGGRTTLVGLVSKEAHLLRVEREFDIVDGFNRDRVQQKQVEYVMSELQRLGDLNKVMPGLPDNFVDVTLKRVDELLATAYGSGRTPNGDFSFTSDEQQIIRANISGYLQKFAKEYRSEELKSISSNKDKLLTSALSDRFATYLKERASATILERIDVGLEADIEIANPDKSDGAPKTVTKHVNLPLFKNSGKDRLQAAALLAADRSEDPNWGMFERQSLKKAIATTYEQALGIKLEEVKTDTLAPEVARWIAEGKRVIDAVK